MISSSVIFQYLSGPQFYCLRKQAKVYIWMVNKLMIMVSQSQELLSNNGFLCFFATTFAAHGSNTVGTGAKMCKM